MNVRNLDALVNATGEFVFAPGVTTVAGAQAAGYYDFGNIVVVGLKPTLEKLEHEGSYRGVRTVDAERGIKAVLEYQLKCDELDPTKLAYAMFGEAASAFTQTTKSTSSYDTLGFTAVPAVLHRWYDIKISGVQVRNATAIVVTTKTEGTDFEVDLKLGRVRFLTAQSSDLNGTVTAPEITSASDGYMQAFTPLSEYLVTGVGNLWLFDDEHANDLIFEHRGFGCSITFDSMDDFDGKSFCTATFKVKVTTPFGTVYRTPGSPT
jgi:hypothetical protein